MIVVKDKIEQMDVAAWEALLHVAARSTVFQSKACYDFYDSLSFMEAFVFSVEEDEVLKGVIVGFILSDGGKVKRYFSRRAIINGGPLLADDISDEALKTLLKACSTALKKKVIYIESRNLNDYSNCKDVFRQCGFRYDPHLGYIVPTPSEEEVNQKIEKRRMQNVRSALRNGVSIVEHPDETDLKAFYVLLEDLYKTRVKTPLYPYEFFQKLNQSDIGLILLLKYEEKVIGGQVSLLLPGRAVYDLFMTGDDVTCKKLRPSTVATYSGIQYAATHNCRYCDLMGAGKPGEQYGVRDFKASFGGQLVEFGRYQYICNSLLYGVGKLAVKIMKRIG